MRWQADTTQFRSFSQAKRCHNRTSSNANSEIPLQIGRQIIKLNKAFKWCSFTQNSSSIKTRAFPHSQQESTGPCKPPAAMSLSCLPIIVWGSLEQGAALLGDQAAVRWPLRCLCLSEPLPGCGRRMSVQTWLRHASGRTQHLEPLLAGPSCPAGSAGEPAK